MYKGLVAGGSIVCSRSCKKVDGWEENNESNATGYYILSTADPKREGKLLRFVLFGEVVVGVTVIGDLSTSVAHKEGSQDLLQASTQFRGAGVV
jgi:hypothetical protein